MKHAGPGSVIAVGTPPDAFGKEMQTVPKASSKKNSQKVFFSYPVISTPPKNIKHKMSIFSNFWHGLMCIKKVVETTCSSFQESKNSVH